MSNERSPRDVCSTTIGTSGIDRPPLQLPESGPPLRGARVYPPPPAGSILRSPRSGVAFDFPFEETRAMPEQTRACRPLTTSENAMALVTLDLISDWHRWVHRRVERFVLSDPVAVERCVSVDFTLGGDIKSPLGRRRGSSVYCVPLGMLRKRK